MPVPIPELPPEYIRAIVPDNLYTLGSLIATAGIGRTFISNAKKAGIELRTLNSGKRKWVMGSDGIEFLKAVTNYQEAK